MIVPPLPDQIFDCLAWLINVTVDAVFFWVEVIIDMVEVKVGAIASWDGGEVGIEVVVLEMEGYWCWLT